MGDEYKNELLQQYDWYLARIEEYHKSSYWQNLPSDSFYLKICNGTLVPQKDDIKWLEVAIDKLQKSLGIIEAHMERQERKGLAVNPLKTYKYL